MYTYRFRRHVDLDELQDTLTLSVLGTENLHGRSRVRLDAWYRLDRQRRTCQIDASTKVGEDLNQLFAGFIAKEFGEQAFQVRRAGQTRVTKAKR
jgi:hypothetical protein